MNGVTFAANSLVHFAAVCILTASINQLCQAGRHITPFGLTVLLLFVLLSAFNHAEDYIAHRRQHAG